MCVSKTAISKTVHHICAAILGLIVMAFESHTSVSSDEDLMFIVICSYHSSTCNPGR